MIDGKDCLSTKALFKTFSKKLAFPDYFGKNWDAFNECINDLVSREGYSAKLK
ncbi:MAG TPA: barstar family protein [Candidatus Kurthia intestinigallinarum]|nr:barstar family protein [Candidatus Kurthia intestinigallinarum]